MALEKRGRNLYRYRSVRTADGRVRKEYLGRGPEAVEAERRAAEARAARKADAAAARDLEASLAEADRLGRELDADVNAAVGAFLDSIGVHVHKGTWRCKRGRGNKRM
jgi:hypothetical protein